MEKRILACLMHAEYEEAAEILKKESKDRIRDILLTIAYESESIAVIGFSAYMFETAHDFFWCECIITLLVNPLCHIEGAYALAFHYAKLLAAHERSEENLELLLFFHCLPEKPLTDSDAVRIAEEIIALHPENKAANEVLLKLKSKENCT